MSVADVLCALRTKGVRIWNENGRLRYQAPRGKLTPEEIEKLRALKAEIIAFFQQSPPSAATDPYPVPRLRSDRAPLTFSQQWRWNGLGLERRHSIRTVAAAVRLSGRLNIHSLRKSLSELVRRHESLRTRIATVDGIPWQEIDAASEYALEIVDLTQSSKSDREIEATRLAQQLVHERFFSAVGPLFVASLLKLADSDHMLIVAMDHIISDGASMGIVWREIFAMYEQAERGERCSLPNMAVQFADYAVWQRKTHDSWMEKHGAYWTKRLAGAPRVRLLADEGMTQAVSGKWAMLPIRLGQVLTAGLREVSQRELTTPVMTVFATYVALMSRLCDAADLVMPFITIGRLHPEVENTIGYFGIPLFLRIELLEEDTFLDLLRRVTNEYGTAYEHADCGRIAGQVPAPEFVWNPVFNWIPQEFDMNPAGYIHNSEADNIIRMKQSRFEVTPRDDIEWGYELGVELSDSKDGISGVARYRADRFALSTMERLERNFLFFAEKLTTQPEARVTAVSCLA